MKNATLRRIVQNKALTRVEREVLDGIAAGESNEETAARVRKSLETVKTLRRRVYAKLGARNAPHAVAIAYQTGVIGDAA